MAGSGPLAERVLGPLSCAAHLGGLITVALEAGNPLKDTLSGLGRPSDSQWAAGPPLQPGPALLMAPRRVGQRRCSLALPCGVWGPSLLRLPDSLVAPCLQL